MDFSRVIRLLIVLTIFGASIAGAVYMTIRTTEARMLETRKKILAEKEREWKEREEEMRRDYEMQLAPLKLESEQLRGRLAGLRKRPPRTTPKGGNEIVERFRELGY